MNIIRNTDLTSLETWFLISLIFDIFMYQHINKINTHGHVSVAKKTMWHTSLLFTGTANSQFSTSRISITTGLISINSHILCTSYTWPYIPNLKEISPVVCEICVPENCPIFFIFSSSLHRFTKVILSQARTLFSRIHFFQI